MLEAKVQHHLLELSALLAVAVAVLIKAVLDQVVQAVPVDHQTIQDIGLVLVVLQDKVIQAVTAVTILPVQVHTVAVAVAVKVLPVPIHQVAE